MFRVSFSLEEVVEDCLLHVTLDRFMFCNVIENTK